MPALLPQDPSEFALSIDGTTLGYLANMRDGQAVTIP